LNEIEKIVSLPDFKGYLSDLGGPSANMFRMKGKNMETCRKCSRPSCIWPGVCPNLETSHQELTNLYKKVNSLMGIKKAFIGSGVRYDLLFRSGTKMPAGLKANTSMSLLRVMFQEGSRLHLSIPVNYA